MRTLITWSVAMLAMMPPVAKAQGNAPSAPEGTTLHIAATGIARSRPDRIIINVPVRKSAATALAARAAGQATIDRLKAALVSAGIPSEAIITRQPGRWGFMGNEGVPGFEDAEADEGSATAAQSQGMKTVADALSALTSTRSANALVEVRLTDTAQIAKVIPVLDSLDLPMEGVPQRSLLDDRPAKSIAIADALKKARSEADSYAQALGYRIVRVSHVSNDCTSGTNEYRAMLTGWSTMMGGQEGDMVETPATACVDFVIEPK